MTNCTSYEGKNRTKSSNVRVGYKNMLIHSLQLDGLNLRLNHENCHQSLQPHNRKHIKQHAATSVRYQWIYSTTKDQHCCLIIIDIASPYIDTVEKRF